MLYNFLVEFREYEKDIKKDVGLRLKECRKAIGKTQDEIAMLMLMTQQQYSRYENGIFELNYGQISFLCKLYNISADYLLGLSEK